MDKVYLLYDCDEWRSHNSIEAGSPIITAFQKKPLQECSCRI